MSGIVPEMRRPQPGSEVVAGRVDMAFVRGVIRDVLAYLFVVAGLGVLTTAAFMHDRTLGIAAIGGSLFVLGLLLGLSA